MKPLRSLLLPAALGIALAAPIAVFAQQANQTPAPAATGASAAGRHWGGRHGHHGMRGRLLRGVTLSDQQKAQIKTIMQQYRQAHPRGTLTDPAARKQARQQLRDQVMNVLTPQQRAQVQQNIQQMRRERQERDASPQPSAPPSN